MNPEIAKLTAGQKLLKQAIHEIDDYFGEGVWVFFTVRSMAAQS